MSRPPHPSRFLLMYREDYATYKYNYNMRIDLLPSIKSEYNLSGKTLRGAKYIVREPVLHEMDPYLKFLDNPKKTNFEVEKLIKKAIKQNKRRRL